MPVLIVLDSNQFYGDVYARRGRLSAVLNGSKNGDFAVLVPRIVIDELTRQFPERVAAARKKARTALKNFAVEFNSLELQLPELDELDEEALASRYRDVLEARLAEHGVGIAPYPALDDLIDKAVGHKKPFGQKGQGFPDAVIWKNVLEAARTADQVVLVTENTGDFGDGSDPAGLAEDLLSEVAQLGLPRDRVRLVTSLEQLLAETVEPLGVADVRAQRLLDAPELLDRLEQAIVGRVLAAPIPQSGLDLPIELDDEPQVDWVDLQSMSLESVRALDQDRLLLELDLLALLSLRVYVFKQDYYVAGDPPELEVTDFDWNDHYLEANIEMPVDLRVTVATDARASDPEVELVSADRAYGDSLASAYVDRNESEIIATATDSVLGRSVENYTPPDGSEGGIDQATVEEFHADGATLEEVEEELGSSIVLTALVAGRGTVRWQMTAPAPYDLETYAADAEPDPRAAGFLSVATSSEPILVLLRCSFSRGEVEEIEVISVTTDRDRLDDPRREQ